MSDTHSESDSDILARSVKEPGLFAVLVDRYQTEFLRKANYIVRNEDEAADIVQDSFVKIYTHARKFQVQEGASAKSWMYRILINTCFTHCKKRKRERFFVDYAASEDLDILAVSEDKEKTLDLDEIMAALTKLPSSLSRLISDILIGGKTYEDIAKSEDVSEGVIRVRVHRAKKELKEALNAYGE